MGGTTSVDIINWEGGGGEGSANWRTIITAPRSYDENTKQQQIYTPAQPRFFFSPLFTTNSLRLAKTPFDPTRKMKPIPLPKTDFQAWRQVVYHFLPNSAPVMSAMAGITTSSSSQKERGGAGGGGRGDARRGGLMMRTRGRN